MTVEKLKANLPSYRGKVIALAVNFDHMIDADKALFYEFDHSSFFSMGNPITVRRVPTARFTEPREGVVVMLKVARPWLFGELQLRYVDAFSCSSSSCSDVVSE